MPGSRSLLGGGVCPGGGYSRGEYPVVATEGVEYPGGGYSGVCLGVGTQGWVLRRVEYQGGYLGGEYLGVGTQA